ncbi:MAG: ACT domain-containing protein [Firmicutes bacterium]|nr:ACT domain-containing protein [Bacillota bacterium]
MTLKRKEKEFYLVSRDILPEAIVKTIQVKEMLSRGEAETVNEAVERIGLSRSAFYKYKDGVFPFFDARLNNIITISLVLEHQAGVLSNVLNTVAEAQGNILTINQGIPLHGMANATLSIEADQLTVQVEELLTNLAYLKGVKKVELIGRS